MHAFHIRYLLMTFCLLGIAFPKLTFAHEFFLLPYMNRLENVTFYPDWVEAGNTVRSGQVDASSMCFEKKFPGTFYTQWELTIDGDILVFVTPDETPYGSFSYPSGGAFVDLVTTVNGLDAIRNLTSASLRRVEPLPPPLIPKVSFLDEVILPVPDEVAAGIHRHEIFRQTHFDPDIFYQTWVTASYQNVAGSNKVINVYYLDFAASEWKFYGSSNAPASTSGLRFMEREFSVEDLADAIPPGKTKLTLLVLILDDLSTTPPPPPSTPGTGGAADWSDWID